MLYLSKRIRRFSTFFAMLCLLFIPRSLNACDTSGYVIQSITDNGDGTFTIIMTILVAGGITTSVGSTYGFYWNLDAQIISVDPMSLTSSIGTTIDAVITGNNVTWGDPNPGGTPFVDITLFGPDESFVVTVVVDGMPTEWWGGGQEANLCPGGAGTNIQNYEGTFPCFEPGIGIDPGFVVICAGETVEFTAIPNHLVDSIVWSTGDEGLTTSIAPDETTTIEVTAYNACAEVTVTAFIQVNLPPTIDAVEPEIEICEGETTSLEVWADDPNAVIWEPTGETGPIIYVTPTVFPSYYTAIVANDCGSDTTEIVVYGIPPPTIDILNDDMTICPGAAVLLQSVSTDANQIEWLPVYEYDPTIEVEPFEPTTYTVTASNNCGEISDTVFIDIADAVYDSLEFNVCGGGSIDYDGTTLNEGTSTDFYFTTGEGCDSIVTVTVNGLQNYNTSISFDQCEGSQYTYNGTALDPGTTTDFSFTTVDDCDSTVSVTINALPTYSDTFNFETCSGATIDFDGQALDPGTITTFMLSTSMGCDSIITVIVDELLAYTSDLVLEACTGSTATYNGQQLDPGTSTDFNLLSEEGCDSIVTVMVNEVSILTETLTLEACSGNTALYNGQPLDAGTSTDFSFVSSQGCDSVLTVVVNELFPSSGQLTLFACQGETATYNNQDLAPGTSTDFTLIAANGCDSVLTVTVNPLFSSSSTMTLYACDGETAVYNGQNLAPGSSTDFTLTAVNGCDSVLTVMVEQLPSFASEVDYDACPGTAIDYAGQTLQPGSVTDVVLSSINGCDSTVTVTVNALQSSTGSVDLQGCSDDVLTYMNTEIPIGTSMDFALIAANGCDSIVTVTALDPLPFVETEETVEICEGNSIEIFGQLVSQQGAYAETFSSSYGCDSIHTVHLEYADDLNLDLEDGITINYGESVVLEPIVPIGTNLTFTWQSDSTLSCTNCQNPTASPIIPTTYYVTVTGDDLCPTEGTIFVIVKYEFGVYVPNVFSPNEDGINDVFMIFSDQKSVKTIHSFQVFSRWGEEVFQMYDFQPDDPLYGWDGTHLGKKLNPNYFAWYAEVEFITGAKKLFKGGVTLVR